MTPQLVFSVWTSTLSLPVLDAESPREDNDTVSLENSNACLEKMPNSGSLRSVVVLSSTE